MKVIVDNLEFIIIFFSDTSSNTSTITVLGVLVGILLIVVIVSVVGNILLLLYVRQYVKDIMFLVINNFHFCRLKSLGTNTIKRTNSGYVVIFLLPCVNSYIVYL